MEGLLILIVGITALVTFWSTFRKAGNAIGATLDVAIDVIEVTGEGTKDSLHTYAGEIKLSNATKRGEQLNRIVKAKENKDMATQKAVNEALEGL